MQIILILTINYLNECFKKENVCAAYFNVAEYIRLTKMQFSIFNECKLFHTDLTAHNSYSISSNTARVWN